MRAGAAEQVMYRLWVACLPDLGTSYVLLHTYELVLHAWMDSNASLFALRSRTNEQQRDFSGR